MTQDNSDPLDGENLILKSRISEVLDRIEPHASTVYPECDDILDAIYLERKRLKENQDA